MGGETPIHYSTACFFCDQPESYHHTCAAGFGDRIRFCPCLAKGLQPLPTPAPTTKANVMWIVGSAGKHEGKSCDAVCADAGGVCDKPDGSHFGSPPVTRQAMKAVAAEAGVSCTSLSSRCDMGEAPIFRSPGCFFCDRPEWYHHRCSAGWGDRIRFCPCSFSSSKTPSSTSPRLRHAVLAPASLKCKSWCRRLRSKSRKCRREQCRGCTDCSAASAP